MLNISKLAIPGRPTQQTDDNICYHLSLYKKSRFKTFDHPSLKIQQNNLRRTPHTLKHPQVKVHNFVIIAPISSIFIENVSEMYINISYKFHRIPDTQSHFTTKVHDLLGQPSYL